MSSTAVQITYPVLFIDTINKQSYDSRLEPFIEDKKEYNQRRLNSVYQHFHPQPWKDSITKLSEEQSSELLKYLKVSNLDVIEENRFQLYEMQIEKVVAELNEDDMKFFEFINVMTLFDPSLDHSYLTSSINRALWHNWIDKVNEDVNLKFDYLTNQQEWLKAKNNAPNTYKPKNDLFNEIIFQMQNERYKVYQGSSEKDLCKICIRDETHCLCNEPVVLAPLISPSSR